MAKIKYNVKGVDAGGDRTMPKAGVHRCKVISCVVAKPSDKDQRIEVQYQVTDDNPEGSKGYVLYDYVNLERDDLSWKLAQFIQAMGLPESGSFDPEDCVGTGLNVRVKIQPETEQYSAKATPATLIPLDGEEGDDEDLTEDEDTGSDDGDTGDGEDEGEAEPWTEDELGELEKAELKEVAEEFEVTWPKRLTDAGKAKVIAAILAAQEAAAEADGEDDEPGDEELWTEEELEALDDDELKGVAFGDPEDDDDSGFELDEDDYVSKKKNPKTKKTVTTFDRDGVIAAILEAQGEGDDGEDETAEEPPDYDAMDPAELKALCKERKLDQKGTKKILIARLKKDDEPF